MVARQLQATTLEAQVFTFSDNVCSFPNSSNVQNHLNSKFMVQVILSPYNLRFSRIFEIN